MNLAHAGNVRRRTAVIALAGTLAAMTGWTGCATSSRASPRPARGPALTRIATPPAPAPAPMPATLQVTATDAHTGRPLPVRIVVRGIHGTATPRFGPEHRGEGAGPVIVAVRGEARPTLAPGRYRVAVSHGPEWSLMVREIEVGPGAQLHLDARLSREVSLPGWVPCDLHVHARPSYDSAVSIEDRVAALVAEGVRFATPTEHNVVGDYGPGVAALPATVDETLSWVPAVEVTTDQNTTPMGHFNVYPYAPEGPPPDWTAPTAAEIFRSARAQSPGAMIQVNHPRMAPGIGYFDVTGLDPYDGRAQRPTYDRGYDAVEVFNGFDLGDIAKVERVLGDYMALLGTGARYVATGSSDSHQIAFQTAGYPRTYVFVGEAAAARSPVDPAAVIRALREGRAFASAGPMVLLTVDDHAPGDPLLTRAAVDARVRLRVLAAPWVTVREAAVYRNGQRVAVFSVAPSASTVRLDRAFSLTLQPGDAVLATARGDRDSLDALLPWSRATPYAFSNPVFVEHPARTSPDAGPSRPPPPRVPARSPGRSPAHR